VATTALTWLSEIGDKPDNYGNVYLNMAFADGTVAYKAGKPADMTKHEAALRAFENGEPQEFLFEDTGKKTQKGAPKMKLVGYPGWEAQSQGNSNSSGGKSWYNSEEGVRYTQERTDRRTALMQAIEYAKAYAPGPAEWPGFADEMYDWLRKTSGTAPYGEGGTVSGSTAESAAHSAGVGAPDSVGAGTPTGTPPPSTCIHPESNRKVTASGKVRCGMCGELIA
jgi:hypothetical protein